jgi:Holliday junction resolvasome RuvABC endonuclease subunit
MIGLGYDPGYGTGGAAAVQDLGAAGYLVLHAETVKTDTKAEPRVRYEAIRARLLWVVRTYEPETAGVEDQIAVWAGQARARSTNAKALHGLVCQGILVGAVGERPVHVLTTAQVKQAVAGHGSARSGKGAVRTAVELMRRTSNVKRLSSHSADAVATAVAALRRERVARALGRSG